MAGRVAVLMGVSGSGKSTVGTALARRLGWRFLDADDFHPPRNVQLMSRGIALTDADRQPWLKALNAELLTLTQQGTSLVLACSALRQRYREALAQGLATHQILWVNLHASPELIRTRLQDRPGHFMPASLLESQFHALEEPAEALTLDAGLPVQTLVEAIANKLAG